MTALSVLMEGWAGEIPGLNALSYRLLAPFGAELKAVLNDESRHPQEGRAV